MSQEAFRISIALGSNGVHTVSVSSRHKSGSIIRSVRKFSTLKELQSVVETHGQAVASFDPAEHEKAHKLASKAAQEQASEYKDKGNQ